MTELIEAGHGPVRGRRRRTARALMVAAVALTSAVASLAAAAPASATTYIGPQQMSCSTGSVTARIPQYSASGSPDSVVWQPVLQVIIGSSWVTAAVGSAQSFTTGDRFSLGSNSLVNQFWPVPTGHIWRVANYYNVNGTGWFIKYSYTYINQARGNPYECFA